LPVGDVGLSVEAVCPDVRGAAVVPRPYEDVVLVGEDEELSQL
jgi:hypothetical protein